MRTKLFCLFLLLRTFSFCKAQEPVVLDTSMFDRNYQAIDLGSLQGWIFHEGNDLKWASKAIDITGWKRLSPTRLSVKNADKNGRAEGWFRLRFKLDSSFSNVPCALQLDRWMAKDVYVDSSYIARTGNTGIDGKPYKEAISTMSPPVILSKVKPGTVYVMAVHVVDYIAPLNPWRLKSELYGFGVNLTGPDSYYKQVHYLKEVSVYFILYTAVCAVLCLLFCLLYFQNSSEKVLLLIAVGVGLLLLQMICLCVQIIANEISFLAWNFAYYGVTTFGAFVFPFTTIILATIFKKRIQPIFLPFIVLLSILPIASLYISMPSYANLLFQAMTLLFYGYLVISSWKNLKGAMWAVVAGLFSTFIFGIFFAWQALKYQYWPFPFCYAFMGGFFLSVPLSLMVYVAMRFKEILKDVQRNAQQILQLSEEKKEQALKQQKILEEEVARQTIELRTSFENLKSTQAQLIQSEKMASLGELTAGIAHEIQNPLNFVNNFSEVSNEMLDEMKEELATGNMQLATEIADDIKQNLEKINHHGKRADAIVKGMLQHSKASAGVKEPTDINKLVDEYLRLSYHGMRAKDKEFNATLQTEFDSSIGKINIVPQDIGRVLLNLFNNAFYATNQKQTDLTGSSNLPGQQAYVPTVTIVTKKTGSKVQISVEDNGPGIPQNIVDKIFQPFFTTKPTGQGTGLGLSLSYDIIKAHGGEIKVDTKEDKGSEFVIQLPYNP